jgi:hypothetical protein
VQVNAGVLGGIGKVQGPVTVASANMPATLAPGSNAKLGALTVVSSLTFNLGATYKVDLNSTSVRADQTIANGVTINNAAQFSVNDLGSAALAPGTVFIVISNTAATPIAGVFGNLADGSTLTIGSNTYLVSYEGGTGNDLTLTVL